jgi:bifunctional NMN adenylyltransferase/nudix hydrolase
MKKERLSSKLIEQRVFVMKYDFLVFIGRFQPFHNGHKAVIDRALELSEKVIVLVGSANGPRSYRNPFTFEERASMISRHFNMSNRILVTPLLDHTYNDQAWIKNVQTSVQGIVSHTGFSDSKIGLIGCNKDESSFYLKLFPNWASENVEFVNPINATDLRNTYFENEIHFSDTIFDRYVPKPTSVFLREFIETDAFYEIQKEYEFVTKYKKSWEAAPYEPIFVTTDAVVVQSGHILLIRRRSFPGKGMLALPGGFVNPSEKLLDGMMRELREETRLKVPEPVLRGSIKNQKVFDEPHRSSRGRTITHAFLIELAGSAVLPKVKGGDDASHAMWVPLNEIKLEGLFEDHYHIIQNMLGDL